MKIFYTSPDTGLLIADGIADESPLEPGVYLIPAHATTVEPPAEIAGSTRHFVAGGWEYRDIQPPAPESVPPTAAELRRAEIPGLLAQIDQRSIRALREGNAVRIAALESQAAALRAELAALNV